MEFSAPEPPAYAQKYMTQSESFGHDLWYIIKSAAVDAAPDLVSAASLCISVIVIVLLVGLLKTFSGLSSKVGETVGAICIASILIGSSKTFIGLGIDTVTEIGEYGKILLPVLTGALAAQGAASTAAALYTGSILFLNILLFLITKIIKPMLYGYIAIAICGYICDESVLNKIAGFLKWAMTWSMKIVLYVFTGYMTITGAISGTTDATAIKATKLAISGVVPVVGGIMSDASETILVSAGVMKNAVGTYGMLAIIAIGVTPFLRCAMQYVLLKSTAGLCGIFESKKCTDMTQMISGAMGLSLAMTGICCLLMFVSSICFMKGAG